MKYSIIFAAAAVASEVYPTTIQDYDHHDCTVTAADQSVLVYHTAYTVTHTESSKYGGYAAPTGTGSYPAPTGCWYEKYEKQEYAPYGKLGKNAIPGYPGSGLCPESDEHQVVYGKEYKNGKWNSYTATHTYGVPQAKVTTYAAAGTYTYPAGDLTVQDTAYYAAEATKSYAAGETCTYGGRYVKAEKTGTITVPYGVYKTGGKEVEIAYKTITVSTTGKYEIVKPTITSYPSAAAVKYPVVSWYQPGVYHHNAETIKADTAGYAYTCTYEQVKAYDQVYKTVQPAYPTATPVNPADAHSYPVEDAAYTPAAYPTAYPTGYPSHPVASEEEDCEEDETKPVDSEHKPEYSAYPAAKPVEDAKATPVYEAHPAEETDCEEDEPVSDAHATPYPAYPAKPVEDASKYPTKPVESEEKPVYSAYPAASPVSDAHATPYAATPADAHATPYVATPADDTKMPVYEAKPVDSEQNKPYVAKPADDTKKPVAGEEEDCEEETEPATGKPVKGDTKWGYKSS